MFAESRKKNNVEQRGRFNLGEKLVIALCEEVRIRTTKGTIIFGPKGRVYSRVSRATGTEFFGILRMNRQEADALRELARMLIPPPNIRTIFNGEEISRRERIGSFIATLPTEVADEDGYLRPTARKTDVCLYEPRPGEKAMIYEMGIPVVETGDAYHVDILQKVPLNSDRDNVTPSYLQKVRTLTLNEMAGALATEDTTKPWVAAALEDKNVSTEAVKEVIESRFGKKAVVFDPSDPEGTKMAVAAGYTVIPSRTFSREAWANVREAGILPAGQVTPSPKPYNKNGLPENVIPIEEWTESMRATVHHAIDLAKLLGVKLTQVKIVREPKIDWVANNGPGGPLTLNYSKLGRAWFENVGSEDQWALFLHEFAHDRVTDHLSRHFADEVARLGAKLAHINMRSQ